MYDYVVIGAGIIGSMVARELSRYQLSVLVVDKENDIANVQTLANSAIIHSGHNPTPGTLKAKLNVLGNKLYSELEKELEIPLLKSGAFVVAHNKAEEKLLEELAETARQNGVGEFALLDYQEAVKTEPNLAKSCTKVLTLPTTMVTYPWEVAFAAIENAIKNGVEFRKNSCVTDIDYVNDHFEIKINDETLLETKYVINAAGINTDVIASMLEKNVGFKIKPRKGEYFVLNKDVEGFIRHVLYPLPTEAGKGVLLTPQVHGNILVGPNSVYVDDKHRLNNSYSGLEYVKDNAGKLAENIPFHKIIRSFAGIRSSSDYDDFYIQESQEYKGLYHLAGIDSPGLSAAPAIAKYLLQEIIKIDALYAKKEQFDPYRKAHKEFHTLSQNEKLALIEKYPTYGNIICKC